MDDRVPRNAVWNVVWNAVCFFMWWSMVPLYLVSLLGIGKDSVGRLEDEVEGRKRIQELRRKLSQESASFLSLKT